MDGQIQQQMISTGQLYTYKSYIETLRKLPNHNSFLQAQGYHKETAGMLMKSRILIMKDLRIDLRYFKGDLLLILMVMSDIFQQDRLLINGVERKINLTQNRNAFCIMAKSGEWKVQLLDAYINICKLTPIPAIILAHYAAL